MSQVINKAGGLAYQRNFGGATNRVLHHSP